MAYSLTLADRLRDCLDSHPDILEKKMFGGLGLMLHGNMFVCLWQEYLVLRLGPEQCSVALKKPHVRPFVVKGKSSKGWVMINEADLEDDLDLKKWLRLAMEFVTTFPGKG